MNNQKETDQFINILIRMLKIFVKKNKDYGASYRRDDVVGTVIRLGDKLQRLKQITKEGHQIMVRGEKLEDTLIDIANYSAIGLMMLQKKNGKEKDTCSYHKQKLVQQSKNCYPELTKPY